jgi:hypothetical protein
MPTAVAAAHGMHHLPCLLVFACPYLLQAFVEKRKLLPPLFTPREPLLAPSHSFAPSTDEDPARSRCGLLVHRCIAVKLEPSVSQAIRREDSPKPNPVPFAPLP